MHANRTLCCTLAIALTALAAAAPARTEPTDPAVRHVEAFHATLIAVMKRGHELGIEGRYKELEPQIEATFDLAVMTRFTVGPAWAAMAEAERSALVSAFRRMTVASYASNFAKFEGQRFVTDPKVESRNADFLVQSQVIPAGAKPVNLTYRLRNAEGKWKVIDVIYEHVSQLATRRADFSTTLASGGAAALVKRLDEISDDLMLGK